MKLLLAGSSGFLGTHLSAALRSRGHDVTRLVRRPAEDADELRWDPYASEVDQAIVAGSDVVVNLAGSPTTGNPHSGRWADQLRDSRVTTTVVLAEAIARAHRAGTGTPAFVNGSAIGFYGDQGAEEVDEQTPSTGGTFISGVVHDWEGAASPAVRAGARVALLRTSPVIDRANAPLKQLMPLFRLGLGAKLGNGRQYFPLVSLRDWVGAAVHAIEGDLAGPANVCCPITPTNAEFTAALADAVGRRARLGVPAKLLEAGAGRVAPDLLGSVRAVPAALQESGYAFEDLDVRDVIAAALV